MNDRPDEFFSASRALMQERRRRVDTAQDFDELFELVKRIVEEELGRHRAGLTLVLASMTEEVGGFHQMGANVIVVNKSLIDGLLWATKSPREVNAFIFMVLMHEYLHSLGYIDEKEVRNLAQEICRNSLGKDHPTVKLASSDWLEMYPQLRSMNQPNSNHFEVVRKFDSSSTSYIR